MVASLGVLYDGVANRWVSETNQWANQQVRTSLAAVNEVVDAAGERANVLVVNYGDADDPATGTNTAYGWAKTYTNVFRTGLPGEAIERSVTYLGGLDAFLAGERTTTSAARATPTPPPPTGARRSGAPRASATPTGRSPTTSAPGSRSSPRRRSCS